MAFGPSAIHLWELAQGIDSRVVTPDRLAKSLSADVTFSDDIEDKEVLEEKLLVDFNDYPILDINSSNGIIKLTP